ncbi:hypothetical protein D3C75_1019540 [compost metagenome]
MNSRRLASDISRNCWKSKTIGKFPVSAEIRAFIWVVFFSPLLGDTVIDSLYLTSLAPVPFNFSVRTIERSNENVSNCSPAVISSPELSLNVSGLVFFPGIYPNIASCTAWSRVDLPDPLGPTKTSLPVNS